MKRNLVLPLLFVLVATPARAGMDPLLAEGRAQAALESALTRLIPPEQFLVQVDASVGTVSERKPVETEIVVEAPAPVKKATSAPVPLPGFVLEPSTQSESDEPPPRAPERRVYRVEQTPVLEALRVHVAFDSALSPETVRVGKRLVEAQLAPYRGKASVAYSSIPMRKSDRGVASLGEIPAAPTPLPLSDEDLWAMARWFGLFLLLLGVLLLARLAGQLAAARRDAAARALAAKAIAENQKLDFQRLTPVSPIGTRPAAVTAPAEKAALDGALRRQLLDRFLGRAEAFRLYYLRLPETERAELCVLLGGPAFDAMLESLDLVRVDATTEVQEPEERLHFHDKNFEDFVAEETWQTSRLFGFLSQLNSDQLVSMANHETPLATCLLLRFLKPATAATVLGSLAPQRRREVLAEVGRVSTTPLTTIAEIEQRMRKSIANAPTKIFGDRARDVAFFGDIVARSADQDGLLNEIRDVRPDLFHSLKRFRVKLEDFRSLPPEVVRRVLGDADNDVLALTLLTVPRTVAEDIVTQISPRRRDIVRQQMRAFRDVSPERRNEAKERLTQRLREALA